MISVFCNMDKTFTPGNTVCPWVTILKHLHCTVLRNVFLFFFHVFVEGQYPFLNHKFLFSFQCARIHRTKWRSRDMLASSSRSKFTLKTRFVLEHARKKNPNLKLGLINATFSLHGYAFACYYTVCPFDIVHFSFLVSTGAFSQFVPKMNSYILYYGCRAWTAVLCGLTSAITLFIMEYIFRVPSL